MTKRDIGLAVAGVTFALDQGSKMFLLYGLGLMHWAQHCREASPVLPVLPFFNLAMVWNCGISFGLFQADSIEFTVIIATMQLLIIVGLVWWLLTRPVTSGWLAAGMGLILGGALGNLIDRFMYQAVADFFQLHAFGYFFYVFNVADAAITLGVCVLIYEGLLAPQGARQKE